ncbi:MAG TPA: TonB-dependent receptor, partial [Gemmatimonadaceae bacterium]|nr:TonB-dependent receptor [Gemmatimonadaceae bacterium]
MRTKKIDTPRMQPRSRRVSVAGLSLLVAVSAAQAQGPGTAGIHGRIVLDSSSGIDARIRITNRETGFSVEVRAAGGRYLVPGLDPGGPYAVAVRAVGFAVPPPELVMLGVGEWRRVDFRLAPATQRLDIVTIAARAGEQRLEAGPGMTVSGALLADLPTLNKDLYDFVRLVPQVTMRTSLSNSGFSAGGVGFRFNNFLINGVSNRTPIGSVTGAFSGLRSVPLEAVREYRVLLAPYDVRYGDFAGGLVNTVTRSGTNEFSGSTFVHARSDGLARALDDASAPPYTRVQYGFTVGGPIIRDRLHVFLAPEWQRLNSPAEGPYLGQPPTSDTPVPASPQDLERFQSVMRGYGLDAGGAGPVALHAPLRSLFARADLAVPELNSRLVLWNSSGVGRDLSFSRAGTDVFPLSSTAVTRSSSAQTTALHVHTALQRPGGGSNEFQVSLRADRSVVSSAVQQPIVRVAVPSITGGSLTLVSGTDELAQGPRFHASTFSLRNNLTIPVPPQHVGILGVEVESFQIERETPATSFGTWDFVNLDDLAAGRADRYEVRINAPNGDPSLRGIQLAGWVGDQWSVGDLLTITAGLRGDRLSFFTHAPRVDAIEAQFGRRTDQKPRARTEWSPRVGIVWTPNGGSDRVIRGGAGVFTTRYPLAWAHAALSNYGLGSGVLRCNYLGGADRYPSQFVPDAGQAPTACAGGATLSQPARDVDLLHPDLRMMRVARGSFAIEQRVPGNLRLTNEVLLTRLLSDFIIVNLALPEPVGTDPYGRVMYAALGPGGTPPRPPDSVYTDVFEVQNTGRNRSFSISTRVETTPRPSGLSGFASYTFSGSRDVQTPTRVNTRGIVAWATADPTGGRHDEWRLGTSANDIPHRVVIAGTWTSAPRPASLAVSLYYLGEAGRPFTYLAFGTSARGDLNGDRSNANDPIYVPRDALDPAELLFSGLSDSTGADASAAAQQERIA